MKIRRQIDGIIEADEIYHIVRSKGQSISGGCKQLNRQPRKCGKKQPTSRGYYERDFPAIIAYISRTGYTVLIVLKDFTIEMIQKSTDITVKLGSTIYTDSAKSYKSFSGRNRV